MYPLGVLLVVVVDEVLLDIGSVIALAGPMEPTTMLTSRGLLLLQGGNHHMKVRILW